MILWLLILYILLVSEFKGKVSVLLGRCCWRDIAVCLPALDTEALICMEEAVESKVTHSILLFFSAPPVHLNMIYTNQIKIDTGQRTTDQLIAKRLMLRINSLVIFQFTACIAWVVQGLVFFLWEPFILGMISWHTSWRYYSVEPIDSDKKIKKINRSYVCKTEIWGWKDK